MAVQVYGINHVVIEVDDAKNVAINHQQVDPPERIGTIGRDPATQFLLDAEYRGVHFGHLARSER